MVYRLLADATMIVHFAFILAVALGGFLAWRWPRLIWLHGAAVAWGAGIVSIGYTCPLTPLERDLRTRGGEQGFDEGWGFVDHYIEGVIYPGEYTPHLRALAAVLIAASWIGFAVRFRARSGGRHRVPVGEGVGDPADTVRSR